jgi:glucose-6-phosphate-specific signal transduction histidine kinase
MDRVRALAEKVKSVPAIADFVRRRSRESVDEEAWQIATALADIEESAARLFQELVPQLLDATIDSDRARDVLQDIGEEYRHIFYHIRDTKFFDYVIPDEEHER